MSLLGAAVWALAPDAATAQAPWSYELGVARIDQQANFCLTEEEVRDIAGIFRRYSPRTGYSAIADTRGCSTGVHSFTPVEVVDEVVVAEGEDNEYRVRFVRVLMSHGATWFLVTTRNVVQP